jgi:hypothetical protein
MIVKFNCTYIFTDKVISFKGQLEIKKAKSHFQIPLLRASDTIEFVLVNKSHI